MASLPLAFRGRLPKPSRCLVLTTLLLGFHTPAEGEMGIGYGNFPLFSIKSPPSVWQTIVGFTKLRPWVVLA